MKAAPFLMFQGQAKDAIALYGEVFAGFEVLRLDENGDGSVALARVSLGGQEWLLGDSPVPQDFTFTPATSIFVDCESEAQLRHLARLLGAGGAVMMAIDTYGFSRLFTWIADRFGVSWQFNLA